MSQYAAELCTLLVDEVYGELSSHVFSTLLRLGRLSLPLLVQHSQLEPGPLKHGLAVLIQQHLALHYTAPDSSVTYYEADWEAAYALIRAGKIITLAEQKLGAQAGELVSNLLLQGHVRIEDLYDAYAKKRHARKAQKKDAIGNADGVTANTYTAGPDPFDSECTDPGHEDSPLVQLSYALGKLQDQHLVAPVRAYQFRPYTDTVNELVLQMKRDGCEQGGKGTKKNNEFELELRKRLRRLRNEAGVLKSTTKESRGKKRPRDEDDAGSRAKRTKSGPVTDLTSGDEFNFGWGGSLFPDDDRAIRVDLEKYLVLSRNQLLAEDAARSFGTTTALVYAALLTKLSQEMPRCRDELAELDEDGDEVDDGPSITALECASCIRASVDLASAFGKLENRAQQEHQTNSSRRQRRVAGSSGNTKQAAGSGRDSMSNGRREGRAINGDTSDQEPDDVEDTFWQQDYHDMDHGFWDEVYRGCDEGSSSRVSHERLRQVEQHLQLLAQEPHSYVRRVRFGSRDAWTVDFRDLIERLRQAELEAIIHERFGAVALRLVRILGGKGKLDEKQIANAALVKQKDIRATLTAMHEAGFLELQELAREATHQPNRTMFLWFFDPARCGALVLEHVYKTMARLLQRTVAERAGLRALLDKAQRTDVVGKEDKYLSAKERGVLADWRLKEEKLLGQLLRLDRLVELFRDF